MSASGIEDAAALTNGMSCLQGQAWEFLMNAVVSFGTVLDLGLPVVLGML